MTIASQKSTHREQPIASPAAREKAMLLERFLQKRKERIEKIK